MKPHRVATDARREHVVLDLLQDQEEQQHPDDRWKRQEHRHDDRRYGRHDWSEHRDQLEQASQDAEHDGIR